MIAAIGGASAAEWQTTASLVDRTAPHMRVHGESLPPIGFVNFCRENLRECQTPSGRPVRVVMNDQRWAELLEINSLVNRAIEPVSDQDLYNVVEYWTYPQKRGDCEDYVLLKKRKLMEYGWPASALLITVARDQNGGGHAVLTVSTDLGDYILDNQAAEVLPWQDTPYSYIKRQSQSHPYVWVSLKRNFLPRQAALPDTARLKVGK